MIVAAARGAPAAAALIGVVALLAAYVAYRMTTRAELSRKWLVRRFESGAPLTLAEATQLLGVHEGQGVLEAMAVGARVTVTEEPDDDPATAAKAPARAGSPSGPRLMRRPFTGAHGQAIHLCRCCEPNGSQVGVPSSYSFSVSIRTSDPSARIT